MPVAPLLSSGSAAEMDTKMTPRRPYTIDENTGMPMGSAGPNLNLIACKPISARPIRKSVSGTPMPWPHVPVVAPWSVHTLCALGLCSRPFISGTSRLDSRAQLA